MFIYHLYLLLQIGYGKISMLKMYNSILPSLKRKVLFRGSILGFLGMLVLLWGGIFLPLKELDIWGVFIFFIGGALIALGLVPYRRLCFLERNPHEISVHDNETLQFKKKGKLHLVLPLCHIQKASYFHDEDRYGIGIWVNHPLSNTPGETQCLFFPYFTKRQFEELQTFIVPQEITYNPQYHQRYKDFPDE